MVEGETEGVVAAGVERVAGVAAGAAVTAAAAVGGGG